MHAAELMLVNEFQRDFPLEHAPFLGIAQRTGATERQVLDMLQRLHQRGTVTRVGPVFRPNSIGVSTLAAVAVPEPRLHEVAELVSGFSEVNHNYEREHRFNLWFVVTASDVENLDTVLNQIERKSGYRVMSLPLLDDYHIDLGFDLSVNDEGVRQIPPSPPFFKGGNHTQRPAVDIRAASMPPLFKGGNGGISTPHPSDTALIAAIQDGFPLVSHPYAEIAKSAGMTEARVIERLAAWLADGVIKRIGIIVRHHELGYRANAMMVWNIPDDQVDIAGQCIAQTGWVSLCYRRPRCLPDWPYNLFCMIHGRERNAVLAQIERLRMRCGLGIYPNEVLFSRQRFKQRGARYAEAQ